MTEFEERVEVTKTLLHCNEYPRQPFKSDDICGVYDNRVMLKSNARIVKYCQKLFPYLRGSDENDWRWRVTIQDEQLRLDFVSLLTTLLNMVYHLLTPLVTRIPLVPLAGFKEDNQLVTMIMVMKRIVEKEEEEAFANDSLSIGYEKETASKQDLCSDISALKVKYEDLHQDQEALEYEQNLLHERLSDVEKCLNLSSSQKRSKPSESIEEEAIPTKNMTQKGTEQVNAKSILSDLFPNSNIETEQLPFEFNISNAYATVSKQITAQSDLFTTKKEATDNAFLQIKPQIEQFFGLPVNMSESHQNSVREFLTGNDSVPGTPPEISHIAQSRGGPFLCTVSIVATQTHSARGQPSKSRDCAEESAAHALLQKMDIQHEAVHMRAISSHDEHTVISSLTSSTESTGSKAQQRLQHEESMRKVCNEPHLHFNYTCDKSEASQSKPFIASVHCEAPSKEYTVLGDLAASIPEAKLLAATKLLRHIKAEPIKYPLLHIDDMLENMSPTDVLDTLVTQYSSVRNNVNYDTSMSDNGYICNASVSLAYKSSAVTGEQSTSKAEAKETAAKQFLAQIFDQFHVEFFDQKFDYDHTEGSNNEEES